jgi:hypothetical protein
MVDKIPWAEIEPIKRECEECGAGKVEPYLSFIDVNDERLGLARELMTIKSNLDGMNDRHHVYGSEKWHAFRDIAIIVEKLARELETRGGKK